MLTNLWFFSQSVPSVNGALLNLTKSGTSVFGKNLLLIALSNEQMMVFCMIPIF